MRPAGPRPGHKPNIKPTIAKLGAIDRWDNLENTYCERSPSNTSLNAIAGQPSDRRLLCRIPGGTTEESRSVLHDHSGQELAYVYRDDEAGRRTGAICLHATKRALRCQTGPQSGG